MTASPEAVDMRHTVVLEGCSPTPLANYLKALGVLRLVGEQVDPEARGYWEAERFVLVSGLDAAALSRFLLDDWQPTPVVAPWNGGSGFYPKDNQSGIGPMSTAAAGRFRHLREAIAQARQVLDAMQLGERPAGELKRQLLMHLRSEFPDVALIWLDGAVLLTDEATRYPPLLGTGGNDGRLDFTNNFLQRLVELFDPDSGEATDKARLLLAESLFAESTSDMPSSAIGQFSPGAAGGPNASTGFEGGATVNPWDFVLMLEGALLFAATASRRLESAGSGALSYPFTVHPTGSGTGSSALADEKPARAEMWLPIWTSAVGLMELRGFLSEGRASLGRRPVRDGLDFMRAVAQLGLERGISSFQRYAFMMRSGKAYLATPLNRVRVQRNPSMDLIDQLDAAGWLERFRRLGRSEHASHQLASLVHRLEDALFDLAGNRDDASTHIQRILVCLGEIQRYLARSPSARENCGPVPLLRENWVTTALAGDDSAELRIAIALAGLHGRRQSRTGATQYLLPLADHLAPSQQDGRRRWWVEGQSHRVVWGNTDLERNLLAVLQRRLLIAAKEELDDKPLFGNTAAPLDAVAAWLGDGLNSGRIASLVAGLALARIPRVTDWAKDTPRPIPATFTVLKPFFCTNAQLLRTGLLPEGSQLGIPSELVRRLETGRISAAIELALRRLRIAGIATGLRHLEPGGLSGRRLLAALLVPISDTDLKRLMCRVHRPANTTENSTS
ncbi:type I-U CRISPR-associated protein Csx17 [Halomonas sp. 25-S5]|uniref:type I-G CRISPR-associated protein Cas8g1/Csx17 n=1 Tax=Halomonas sp. 25-S5 TaxID=2994065 RepID=UPI00246924B7|nr:type I-U CRISPR-associated protein Csx17 [Halomonas sp. 25-S5]